MTKLGCLCGRDIAQGQPALDIDALPGNVYSYVIAPQTSTYEVAHPIPTTILRIGITGWLWVTANALVNVTVQDG